MSQLDRRDLLKLGASGFAGLTLGGPGTIFASDLTAVKDESRAPSSREAFQISPGLIRRLDPATNRVVDAGLWGLPAAYAHLAPTFAAPLSFSMEELQAWADARSGSNGASLADPGVHAVHEFLTAPILGGLNLTEVSSKNFLSLREHGAVSISLDFAESDRTAGAFIEETGGVQVLKSTPSGIDAVVEPIILPVTAFGWRVQLRGPDNHPFGSCTPRGVPVKHFNLEIFRHIGSGRYRIVKNYHLGTYRSGGRRCFVLYQNIAPGIICVNDCSPTLSELAAMIAFALAVSALIVAVAISSSTIATIATTAAASFFAVLLLSA